MKQLLSPQSMQTKEISEKKPISKRRIYDIILMIGWLCCLVPGPFPSLIPIASIILALCFTVSFFDENLYMYAALFIYMRYIMLIGDSPVFRLYSYVVVLKFLLDLFNIKNTKFRMAYFPALFAFFLHSVFATPGIASMRIGLNVIVDCVLIYIIIGKVLAEPRMTRKFMFVFLLGGITSGVYGWTNKMVSVDINVLGAGAYTVNRNFGSLSDSNFAGLIYSLCIVTALALKTVPNWLKAVFVALFGVMLLQTASLSALLVLSVLTMFYVILKYRAKSIFMLTFVFVGLVVALVLIYTVPQLQQIQAIAGLIIRIKEKLSYIPRGRWDLITTGRSALWGSAFDTFLSKSWWGKLIGGSVLTVMVIDYGTFSIACHNSYIQSLLDFGIIGTLMIYIPLFIVFAYRLFKHFSLQSGYDDEDVKILGLVLPFSFIVFGLTVDFFIDWPYVMLYFF